MEWYMSRLHYMLYHIIHVNNLFNQYINDGRREGMHVGWGDEGCYPMKAQWGELMDQAMPRKENVALGIIVQRLGQWWRCGGVGLEGEDDLLGKKGRGGEGQGKREKKQSGSTLYLLHKRLIYLLSQPQLLDCSLHTFQSMMNLFHPLQHKLWSLYHILKVV